MEKSLSQPLLEVRDLRKHYSSKTLFGEEKVVRALDGVSFPIYAGETMAVVGESGCGKSTLAKLLMQVESKTSGDFYFQGKTSEDIPRSEFFQSVQMVFQDPYGSLNPRKKVFDIIAEPLVINTSLSKTEIKDRVMGLMQEVGLRPEHHARYPHMFSGGQRQRIGIARALTLNPQLILCDEPVSALDISIQAQVLNLLMKLQDEKNLSYLFISHDLSVVKHISHRVTVMYFGKIVEMGTREEVFEETLHPYTQALLASTPGLNTGGGADGERLRRNTLKGEMPSPLNPPKGCAFHSRCPLAEERCRQDAPELVEKQGHLVACHLVKG